ncbi:MAG: hypothetical protein ACXV7D_00135 [Thermoanaerobaculia bacterium]
MDQQSPQQSTAVTPQSSTTTPSAQGSGSILGDLLRTLGVKQGHADEVHQQVSSADVNKQIDQAHQYVSDALQHARTQAANNPGLVLGGLSALVIAAGMLRGRR